MVLRVVRTHRPWDGAAGSPAGCCQPCFEQRHRCTSLPTQGGFVVSVAWLWHRASWTVSLCSGMLLSARPGLSSPQLYGADDSMEASRKDRALAPLSHNPVLSETPPARTVGLWGPWIRVSHRRRSGLPPSRSRKASGQVHRATPGGREPGSRVRATEGRTGRRAPGPRTS